MAPAPPPDPSWLEGAPPDAVVGDGLALNRVDPTHADALYGAVIRSLSELGRFMTWATPDYDRDKAFSFTRMAAEGWAAHRDFPYVIIDRAAADDEVVGTIGLINRVGPGALEVGYWVATPHTGRGIARRATALLVEVCRGMPSVEVLEIHHLPENHASRTIPEALGFTLEGERDFDAGGDHPGGRFVVWTLPVG